MNLGQPTRLRLLRLALLFCSLTWGLAIPGVFVNWNTAARALQGLGATPVAYDPMLDYWLRMAAGAFGLLGIGYLLLAIHPRKHATLLGWAGWLMVLEGMTLTVHGFRLALPPFPFYADAAACLLGGVSVLSLRHAAEAG